ncbi:hypothetical protein U9M48_000100, partial [Paspalum notatum var. saurae]
WSPHRRHPLGGHSWSPISFELATRLKRNNGATRKRSATLTFAALQPPIFTVSTDPLDADDWLRIIESKFSLLPHLMSTWSLGGPVCFIPGNATAGHQVTWDEFRAAFRAHYLPPSLIELKQREFRALRQGNMSVLEYVRAFIRPSQVLPEDVDTDPRRATRPLDGFDPTPPTHLGRGYDGFTELVDVAIDMEDRLNHAHEDRRRKRLASTLRSEFLSAATGCASSFTTYTLHRHAPATRTTPGDATTLLLRCTSSSACFSDTGQTKCQIPLLQLWKDRPFQQELFCPSAKPGTIVDQRQPTPE